MKKLTNEQAIIITGYTGVMTCKNFSDFHEEVEKRMGRPVWTHEMGDKVLFEQIKELFREDFLNLIPQEDIDEDISKLYYESHITIEPVFDEHRSFAAGIAETYNFKLADLLMKKRSTDTETRSDKDTFMTGHSKSFKDIEKRTRDLVVALQKEGFKVWRYKIEDTLMDSRSEDVWGLLGDKNNG